MGAHKSYTHTYVDPPTPFPTMCVMRPLPTSGVPPPCLRYLSLCHFIVTHTLQHPGLPATGLPKSRLCVNCSSYTFLNHLTCGKLCEHCIRVPSLF